MSNWPWPQPFWLFLSGKLEILSVCEIVRPSKKTHPVLPQIFYGKAFLNQRNHEEAQKQFFLWTLSYQILLEYHAVGFKEHHYSRSRTRHGIEELCGTFRISRMYLNLDSETLHIDRDLKGQQILQVIGLWVPSFSQLLTKLRKIFQGFFK